MKWKKNWIICSAAVLLLLAVCFMKLRSPTEIIAEQTEVIAGLPSDNQNKAEQNKVTASGDETVADASEESYTSPIDFEKLWKESEDIYAWLDIPDTQISYPILQNEEDDTYYLRRNAKGESDVNGVLYTEATYNSKDFSDPLTVVYKAYSQLQSVSKLSDLDGDLETIIKEVSSGLTLDDLVVRDLFDVSVSGTYADYLNADGNYGRQVVC